MICTLCDAGKQCVLGLATGESTAENAHENCSRCTLTPLDLAYQRSLHPFNLRFQSGWLHRLYTSACLPRTGENAQGRQSVLQECRHLQSGRVLWPSCGRPTELPQFHGMASGSVAMTCIRKTFLLSR